MKIFIKCLFAIIFLIILIIIIMILSNPLRKSDEKIRADMLKLTPIGTSMEDVIKVVENNDNWEIQNTWDRGYSMKYGYPTGPHQDSLNHDDSSIIGVKYMVVSIGSYNFFLVTGETTVYVYYAFDEDSKLVDIAVGKQAVHL